MKGETDAKRVTENNVGSCRSFNDFNSYRLHELEEEKIISEDEQERGEQELQKITDGYIEELNYISQKKESEIMEV